MRLFLIRHGQTEWNNASRAQGHTDIALDATGRDQAARLGEAFGSEDLSLVLTSDLRRSVETAEPIARATGAPMECDDSLRERTFGEWEGHNFEEVGRRLNEMLGSNGTTLFTVRPPAGESLTDVWARLGPVAERLHREEGNVAVVAHGGSTALLLARLVHGTVETSRAFRFANTGVTELKRRPDGAFYIARYNDTTHMAQDKVLSGDLDGTHR